MEPVVKKGRGRPRKNALPPPISEEEEIEHDPFDLSDLHAGQAPTPTPEPPAQPAQPAPAPPAPTVQVGGLTFEDLFRVEPEKARGGRVFAEERPSKDTLGLLLKIKKYKSSFEVLRDFQVDEKAPPEVLEMKLNEMREAISGKNLHAIIKGSYLMGCKGIEGVGCRVGMKLSGLSQMLGQSVEVDNILKEIECEMGCGFKLRPEQRLLVATLSSALVVDSMNRRAETVRAFTGEAVKTEVTEKYAGL